MSRIDDYRKTLTSLDAWEPFLLRESGLPGPRGNLELAAAVAELGSAGQFARWLTLSPEEAPVNSPQEFLVFCAVRGQGRLLAEGQSDSLAILRRFASDPRWRTREAVAMALQRWGDDDMDGLLAAMADWSCGTFLEQRAAAAALCEPRLLVDARHAGTVQEILDAITFTILSVDDRRDPDFRVLRQALGYCWSVSVAALPESGKAIMERWCGSDDSDVRWIMRENLRKKRLQKMDDSWTAQQRHALHDDDS